MCVLFVTGHLLRLKFFVANLFYITFAKLPNVGFHYGARLLCWMKKKYFQSERRSLLLAFAQQKVVLSRSSHAGTFHVSCEDLVIQFTV